jgi:two-component system sensor histidine kinase BaeS
MSALRRVSLRTRLAGALAVVAVASVALATVLANAGLSSRLDQSAHSRLRDAAAHLAALGAEIYARAGARPETARRELAHLAAIDGLRIQRGARAPGEPTASVAVVVNGRTVDRLVVSPRDPAQFREPDRDLHDRLNELHLLAAVLAGGLGVVAAVLLAIPLARPLRRLTDGARRMEHGDVETRIEGGGGLEMEQLAQALNRLAATLQREEELRREAAADLAHELRTPLTGIVSRIEAAQDGVLADEAANLAAMHAEALRLGELTDDLGRLAEAQQPALLTARAPIDLAALATARTAARASAFTEKRIELRTALGTAVVAGDERRLMQVLDNLLSNALRYTDPGGTVTVRTFSEGEYSVLEVVDTGIGLTPEELPHVFERFWRSDKSRARSRGGAGIGLAIVHELVRAHEGHIAVASRPGEGSTFSVKLRLHVTASRG